MIIALKVAGIAMVGLTAIGVAIGATGQTGAGHASADEKGLERCAKACGDCQRTCDACTSHCIAMMMHGHAGHDKTLKTCQDCATICAAAAQIVARHGPFADSVCQACAEACSRCGKACAEFATDATMKNCADECRRCEKECRDMLKHTGA